MPLIPGLQTHIEERIDPAEVRFVADRGFRMARIAAMECAVDVMQDCVRDVEAVGLRPFITIADPERMRLFPGRDFECRNEDDGDISPLTYRRILNDMAKMAKETGSRLWGPTCSNTNARCVRWARWVRGSAWPEGMHGLSWHSYDPHENRAFDAVKALADGMPIIFSEFGYPSTDGEDEQARKLREFWTLYDQMGIYAAILFQIHDGSNPNEREHRYGIRRCDANGQHGDWKPSAYTVPIMGTNVPHLGTEEMIMLQVYSALRRKDAIPHPTKPGYYTSPHPDNDGTVLAIETDRTIGKRAPGTAGPWETWRDDGTKAVFEEAPGGVAAILLVD